MEEGDSMTKVKDRALQGLSKRIEEGKSIKNKDLQREDSALLSDISKSGGIASLARELGISKKELIEDFGLTRNIERRTLTKEEMLNRLLYLKSKGRLTTSAMRTDFEDYRLETSMKKIYGSVREGLKIFNLKSDRIRHSKKSLEKKIREYSNQGLDMFYTSMMNIDSTLIYNSTNVYKMGWHSILDLLGVEYEAKRRPYCKESIQERLRVVEKRAGIANYKTIQMHDASILHYAYENYGNMKDFYIDMGMNPNDLMDFSKQTLKGFEFEKTFKKLLDLLQIEYISNKVYKDKKIRPDFRLNNNVWIDCKLSAWTFSIGDTIENYTPYCEKLIIVFLRGEYKHLPEIDNAKVEFRKIDYYYPFLREINRHDLIEDFENIQNNDFLESVTTERLIS